MTSPFPRLSHAPPEMIVKAAKAHLRSRMLSTRRLLTFDAHLQRSSAITRHLDQLVHALEARHVGVFLPMGSEPALRPLYTKWLSENRFLYVPRIHTPDLNRTLNDPNETSELMTLSRWDDQTPTQRTALGSEQPVQHSEPVDIDAIVVPAIAVDERGHRLGYGKGYYDRMLQRYSGVQLIAAVFDFQRISELPSEPHDVAMTWIVTDRLTKKIT